MAKIDLTDNTSGYASASQQNANNALVETHLNDKVLYRDNPTGEANTMQQELDMNSNQIRNVSSPNADGDVATKAYADSLLSGTEDAGSAQLRIDIASSTNGEGAALVGIEDAAGTFTATTVEGALAEVVAESVALAGTQTVTGDKTLSGTTTLSNFIQAKGSDVASASALTLGDGNAFDITGTTTITSIATKGIGVVVRLHFDEILTLTYHATDLILPGGANITTAAGDEAEFFEYAAGDWRCLSYQKAASNLINTKIIDIGDWDMDATDTVSVAHGLTLGNIRSVGAMLRNDAGTTQYQLSHNITVDTPIQGAVTGVTATNITLARRTGGGFDGTSFDSTSFNRGWITIWYVD